MKNYHFQVKQKILGLFHKAISQSGAALNTWATVTNPKQYAYKLCKSLGKEIYDPKEIVEFLRTIDSSKLAEKQEEIRTKEVTFFLDLCANL